MLATVYIVGAGPGDPDLITLKGDRLLREADVVVYAGSLINLELLKRVKKGCALFDSAKMTLEEICAIMVEAARGNQKVVRLHSGDPSLYGALREQMGLLKEHGINFTMVPGVSSFSAAAAAVQKEYTLPEITQTVILTRLAGRTPVPEKEKLGKLAKHGASMVIFLSIQFIGPVVEDLKEGYDPDTPIAVVYKASWEEERIIRGTLKDIARKVQGAGLSRSALILVGRFLGEPVSSSRLYAESFTHGYREGCR
jgi:precorrin-4/cobalt-precorrin-4 C11-methyltransferase